MHKALIAIAAIAGLHGGLAVAHSINDKIDVNGLMVGRDYDAQKMKHAGLSCTHDKSLHLRPPQLFVCLGKVSFLGETYTADVDVEQRGGRRVIQTIMLFRNLNDFDGHAIGTSFEDLERKLVAFYGQPDVLRTESPLQPIQYKDSELDYPRNSGEDAWYLPGPVTIMFYESVSDVQPNNPFYIMAADIFFSAKKMGAQFDMPIKHPFPVVLRAPSDGSHTTWTSGDMLVMHELRDVHTYGMKCMITGLPPAQNAKGEYPATLTCVHGFHAIAVPTKQLGDHTHVFLYRGNDLVAEGYVNERKADPSE